MFSISERNFARVAGFTWYEKMRPVGQRTLALLDVVARVDSDSRSGSAAALQAHCVPGLAPAGAHAGAIPGPRCPMHSDQSGLGLGVANGTGDFRSAESGEPVCGVIAIQTNLDTALRLQIPKGSGFFLLTTNAPGAGNKRIGILMEPP